VGARNGRGALNDNVNVLNYDKAPTRGAPTKAAKR